MKRVRPSTAWLLAAFLLLLLALLLLRDVLRSAHIDESIEFVASDAATYFSLYEDVYEPLDLADSAGLFLVGSPILFMKLTEGNLFLIQLVNLALMAVSLWAASDCFATQRGRSGFIAGAFVFPYFLFGFLSLNKEVYAMCSGIFYASYLVRGLRSHLLAALLLAACARYYMVFALLALLFLVPRTGRPRYVWAFALLIAASIAAPSAKSSVSGFSNEGVLDVSGTFGLLFSSIIDSYGYVLVYPFKYLALMPLRAYAFLLGSGRSGDAMEGVVSIASLVVFALGIRLLWARPRVDMTVRRLVVSALVAPIPIMWNELMSWRYYSFVYFFFLFAIVLHGERIRSLRARAAVLHA
ncbi:MAG: hypothetical protein ABJA61_04070 [Caldimonas sp.]